MPNHFQTSPLVSFVLLSRQCNQTQLSLILSSKWTRETETQELRQHKTNLPSRFPNLVIAVFCSFMSSWHTLVNVVEGMKVFDSAITSRVRDDDGAGREQWGDRAAVGGRVNRKMIQRCTREKASLWRGGFLDWVKTKKLWNSTEKKERQSNNY